MPKTLKIALLTDPRYIAPKKGNAYVENILLEDRILSEALKRMGFESHRISWDDKSADWPSFNLAIFRTTWDYYDRFPEFEAWMADAERHVPLLNEPDLIRWNWDKFYLRELHEMGLPIPPTLFIPKNSGKSLQHWTESADWKKFVLKPAVGGGGRHTYSFTREIPPAVSRIFSELNEQEAFLLQQFQESILVKGEVSLMVMDGRFTHAVQKRARPGDFRVQDDFGGTVHHWEAAFREKDFAEQVFSSLKMKALYGRVDVIWDGEDRPCISELELLEPELWFRHHPPSADVLAKGISDWALNKQKEADIKKNLTSPLLAHRPS